MIKSFYKVSYYVFYVCIAAILVILVLFFGFGYNETNAAGLHEPVYTSLLIYLMYIMLVVAIIAVVVGGVWKCLNALKDNLRKTLKSVTAVVLLVSLLTVTYHLGSDKPVLRGVNNAFTDAFWLKVSDMFLYTIYVLLVVAVFGTLMNLVRMFRK